MARRRRRQKQQSQKSQVDEGGLGFVNDNATDFYPDGVESPSIIEAKYKDQTEKQFKHLENKLLKVLLS